MDFLSIIILGFVQGIAEFLPISSSAHLIIFRDLFGIGQGMDAHLALTFDLALHFGTLLAIGIYFFKDFITMISKGFTKGIKDEQGKMLWYLVVATIPAAIAGVLFEEVIENTIRKNYVVIALALAVMGVIIYFADKYSKSSNNLKKMTIKDALIINTNLYGKVLTILVISTFILMGTMLIAVYVIKYVTNKKGD